MSTSSRAVSLLLSTLLLTFILAGPGNPALEAQTITVSSASPNSAPQGTLNLNVTITGKGFKRGAASQFFVTGTTNPGGVTVNSTAFVGSTQLTANINIADTATISSFDIAVTNSDGRTGKGIELFAVTAKGTPSTSSQNLARADYRDSLGDRILSDGRAFPCGFDYVGKNDQCTDVLADKASASEIISTTYFLRTLATCCDNTSDPAINSLVRNPTRWLVLDFSQVISGTCPNLDQVITNSNQTPATPPLNPNQCIDFLEVRFFADKAFQSGAAFTSVSLIIDAPDLIVRHNQQPYTQWNAKYCVNFVNPLTITPDPADPNSETLTTIPGLEQVELRTFNSTKGNCDTLLGTYWMPFQVKVQRVP